jgi:hypothetical protein
MKRIFCVSVLVLSFARAAWADNPDQYLMEGDFLEFTRQVSFVNKSKFQESTVEVEGRKVQRGIWERCDLSVSVDANTTKHIRKGRKLKVEREYGGTADLESGVRLTCWYGDGEDFNIAATTIKVLEATLPVKVRRAPPLDRREEDL